MKKKNYTFKLVNHKQYPILILFGFIMSSLIILAMIQLSSIYTTDKLESEWRYVDAAYTISVKKAKEMNINNVKELQEKINNVYIDNHTLNIYYDLQNLSDVTPLTIILDDVVTNKYLFNIANDNNDPFIMNAEMIITDKSFNCSSNGDVTRTLEQEASIHHNPVLAKKALDSIVNNNSDTVIWNFLPIDENLPWSQEIKDLQYVDLSVLKELFFKYNGDIRVLEPFEFLTPYYIYRDKDLSGQNIISYGTKNKDATQLIIVQGFNIVDAIDYSGQRYTLDSTYNSISNFVKIVKLISILLVSFIFIITYILSLRYNNFDSNN